MKSSSDSTEKAPRQQKTKSRETARLEEQLKIERSARLRLAADLANLERRIQQERQALVKLANRQLLEQIFPILDNFYRADQHAPKLSSERVSQLSQTEQQQLLAYTSGLRLIEKQLEEVLAAAGLRRIATKGQPFDPCLHEAISYEPHPELPEGAIIEEIEAGWQIDDQVIRPAKVRVSKGRAGQ